MTYTCQYCRKDFIKESSLAVHSCEPRRRRQEQNEAGVRLGFNAYLKFYELQFFGDLFISNNMNQ
jgi:hypothetical protein